MRVAGIQIQEMPVSSAIMMPWHKEIIVHNGKIEMSGESVYANFEGMHPFGFLCSGSKSTLCLCVYSHSPCCIPWLQFTTGSTSCSFNTPQFLQSEHNPIIYSQFAGWAYSGGGRWPERVEISSNGGYTWYAIPNENLSTKHKFAWRTWHGIVPCDHEGWIELAVRCWDNSLNTQPMEVRHSWNWGLHVTSSVHKVKVYSVNASRGATLKRLKEFQEHKEGFIPITRPTDFPTMSAEEYEKAWAMMEPRDVDD